MDEAEKNNFLNSLMTLDSETEPKVRVNREIKEKMTTGVSAYTNGYNACNTPQFHGLTSFDDKYVYVPKISVVEPEVKMNREIKEKITTSSTVNSNEMLIVSEIETNKLVSPKSTNDILLDLTNICGIGDEYFSSPICELSSSNKYNGDQGFNTAAQDHMAFDTTVRDHISQLSGNVPVKSDREYACNGE